MPLQGRIHQIGALMQAAPPTPASPESWVGLILNGLTAAGVLVWVLNRITPAIDSLAAQMREEARRTQTSHDRLARAILASELERPDLSRQGRKVMTELIKELDAADAERTALGQRPNGNGR